MNCYNNLLKIFKYLILVGLIVGFVTSLVCFAKFNITEGEPVIIESKIQFQLVDFDFSIRNQYEQCIGNGKIWLADKPHLIQYLYTNKSDVALIWKISPFELARKNKTYKVKLITNSLYFGGYSKAKIINIKAIDEKPVIRK